VASIIDKVHEAMLQWYGHEERRKENNSEKRIIRAEVYGKRSRGRQKKRWMDVVQQNLKQLKRNEDSNSNSVRTELNGEGELVRLTPLQTEKKTIVTSRLHEMVTWKRSTSKCDTVCEMQQMVKFYMLKNEKDKWDTQFSVPIRKGNNRKVMKND